MINTIFYPEKGQWSQLCIRPSIQKEDIGDTVRKILEKVRKHGDAALSEYTKLFNGTEIPNLMVKDDEAATAAEYLSENLKDAIRSARKNIEMFHKAQTHKEGIVETVPGVRCWRKSVAIEKVGLYIPGGNAPLFSTVLMLGIPAIIAGCREIILCSPPGTDGKINPVILYTAKMLGIKTIFKVGGAQAIAAMAYGTETIPRVNKIFGPGNQYVTKAKEIVQSGGTAIDMPAGPSEVLVIADDTANPQFVAADLISQAEHGSDSQVVLVTTSKKLLEDVKKYVYEQVEDLPVKTIASESLDKSLLILLPSVDDCICFSNIYAPEHLIIATTDAMADADRVTNAGSVFIGRFSCESAGDYASGTNHTLPTNGYAKSYSGLSVDSFVKKITFQHLTEEGLQRIGNIIETMAEAETLYGHSNAVSIRLKTSGNE
jgi:histidinol dehydrogenase